MAHRRQAHGIYWFLINIMLAGMIGPDEGLQFKNIAWLFMLLLESRNKICRLHKLLQSGQGYFNRAIYIFSPRLTKSNSL